MRRLLSTLFRRDFLSPTLLLLNIRGALLNLRFSLAVRDNGHLILLAALFLIVMATFGSIYYGTKKSSSTRELNCLALNISQEARGEPLAGQFAVARVTLNRVKSHRFPDTICEVVYQKRWDRIRKRYVGAFSWTELPLPQQLDNKTWKRAWEIAESVYHNHTDNELEGALFYHASRIRPSWARHKKRITRIGRHIFYR